MRRLPTPLAASHKQLRLLFSRRCFTSSSPPPHPQPHRLLHPHLPLSKPSFPTTHSLSPPFSLPSRFFSSHPDPNPDTEEHLALAQSLSSELLKDPTTDPLSLTQRLDLSFSHVKLTPSVILQTLDLSPGAGRAVLGFHKWASSRPDFKPDDETLSHFVNYLGRRKDFKAAHDVLVAGRGVSGAKTLESAIDRLVRAGRPTQVTSFFEKMENDYGFARNSESMKLIVTKLCENGFASHAEKMVKGWANKFFPDDYICDVLIKGWCVDGKLEEARRLAGEMYRGGFEIGVVAYNAILDCVCKLCRKKDPFRLQSEAEKVLVDMDVAGVPCDVETFNVLITNLCKIRKTEDAMNLFHRMGEWGCYPDETIFLVLIKSLYQAARIGEGDEMIDQMKSAGFGEALDRKAYYEFLKILCGIERIDQAMSVFTKMKDDGFSPGIKTYDLLMGKLVAHGRVDKANALFKEAESSGVPVEPKAYKMDPRFVKKPVVLKKEKKRETLPEKMARKRRRLKKIRLSFVKKPKRGMRRAY
ncbi:small ribosomal subunit protein mL104 (rPPR9) [Rhododendron vialii]|uniref:small ribosomal subunit protein mL104 (rPPR9) n=1 Tax=Rhododendron vialii TaxID=182163 RepID=UPI00265DB9BF|nr:small ribosomal subunit protein mL104 (rPPR9) [Rhododendron vialii]